MKNIIKNPLASMQKVAVVILCTVFGFSCQNDSGNIDNLLVEMGVNGDQLSSLKLKGTKWKLEGLYYSESDYLKVLEPEGYKYAYTIVFTTNTRFEDAAILVGGYSQFFIELSGDKIHGFMEHVGGCGHLGLYINCIGGIKSYSISNSEMRFSVTCWDGEKCINPVLLFRPFCESCEPEKPKEGDDEAKLLSFNLKGTKWKMESIYNSVTESFHEPESPLDICEDCYTLTFDTNTTAKGFERVQQPEQPISIVFSGKIVSKIEQSNSYGPIEDYIFNYYFHWALIPINAFTISESKMVLYNRICGDYLIYKQIKN